MVKSEKKVYQKCEIPFDEYRIIIPNKVLFTPKIIEKKICKKNWRKYFGKKNYGPKYSKRKICEKKLEKLWVERVKDIRKKS